ncbi:AfsR/SARP family transcriptional regulator [Paractinoplanes atraurantiacus]|uniref:DNA-binding transcriptional activator of the SARP family n=1 Tax=Paractinoplanes atraurantiacus TaxID=1036182 RepID=A0A285KB22_9ACTN|nr:BTAD domain-containing putative transcriptional regulator [Actinoplanes atraurantiacus]SNY69799.1 DNA-binding transcriptional activator of the SARP family [Actinoplanes atraurantiacus]
MTAASQLPAGDGPEALRLQIMGPLRVWRGGAEINAGPRQQRCLLALLLARGGHPISMTELVALIWGADPPVSAISVIHKYVGVLRRLLEPGLLPRTPGSFVLRNGNGYRITAGADTLDLMQFRRHVAAARAAAEEDRCEQALAHYSDALRLCRGSAGESLSDSAGATAVFAGIDGEFFDAAVAAADLAIRLRRPSGVLSPLRLAAEMDPFNELVHASLVNTLAAAGQQAEALAVYRTIRKRLADDLGIDPGQSLQQAHQQVLTQSAPPPAPEPPHPPVVWPVSDGLVPAPLVRPAQLPPDLSLFVGRSAELAVLGDLVAGMRDDARTGPLVVAIDGMGGVGKSTLAARFARSVAGEFTDGQLYLDLHGEQGDALLSLLYALGVPASNVPDTFDAQVGTYRSLTAGKRILVLLDNVVDPARVRPLLPNSAESLVLITSRRPLLGLAAFEGAHLMHLDVPDPASARELLLRRLSATPNRTAAEPDAGIVDEIIESCGRLPLAVAILAARLTARPSLSLASVAAGLRGARRLESFPGGLAGHDPRAAFAWSYRQLSDGARRLFRLLGVALGPGVTAAAAASLSGLDPDRTRAELDELCEAALVTEHEDGRFTSHVLVKAYAEELLRDVDPAGERRAAISRLLQYYVHSSFNAQVVLQPHRLPIEPDPALPGVAPERPGSYEEAIAWFAGQREVLKEAVRVAADLGYGIAPWQLAITMQQYLQWTGRFQEWEEVMRWALDAARAGGDEIGEAHALRSLAGARWSLGGNEEALELLLSALEIFENRDMVLEQALVHTNLHWVDEALGRDHEALLHGERALKLYRTIGYRRAETFGLMSNGRSLARLGRLEESGQLLEQALELHQQIRGDLEAAWDATLIAVEGETRMAIAANLAQMGRLREAAEQLELSAETSRRVRQRPNEFEALGRLAELRLEMGDPVEARAAVERARQVLAALPDGGPEPLRARFATLTEKLERAGAN